MPKLTANYLTTDAQGRIGADFAGHISAAGVDLLASTSGTPPIDRRIAFHDRTMAAAQVAQFFATTNAIAPTTNGSAIMKAMDPTGAYSAFVASRFNPGNIAGNSVEATASGPGFLSDSIVNIINGLGESDFLKTANMTGFYAKGTTVVNVNINLRWQRLVGVFQHTCYTPGGATGPVLFNTQIDGIGVLTSTQGFYFNVSATHLTMPMMVAVFNAGARVSAGTYTFRLNTAGTLQDAEDHFQGMFFTY